MSKKKIPETPYDCWSLDCTECEYYYNNDCNHPELLNFIAEEYSRDG